MASYSDLPKLLQNRLKAELKPGEQIVWVGQPNPDRYMKYGFWAWLFFIPWTAFSVFWMYGASGFGAVKMGAGDFIFALFGLPFVLIGIGGMCAPWWLRRKSYTTVYAITDQRAITIEGSSTITVNSYLPSDMRTIERTEYADGTGNLTLRVEQYRDSEGDSQTRRHGFTAIDNVRNVERLIEELKQANPA